MKTIDDNFRDWEAHVFGFGYGTGEQWTLPAVKSFLCACPEDGNYDHEILEKAVGSTIAWLLINILAHADIIEYGTSPRFGWLTEQGRALRAYVATKTAEELYELTDYDESYTPCYPDACNCGPRGYDPLAKCRNPFWRNLEQ